MLCSVPLKGYWGLFLGFISALSYSACNSQGFVLSPEGLIIVGFADIRSKQIYLQASAMWKCLQLTWSTQRESGLHTLLVQMPGKEYLSHINILISNTLIRTLWIVNTAKMCHLSVLMKGSLLIKCHVLNWRGLKSSPDWPWEALNAPSKQSLLSTAAQITRVRHRGCHCFCGLWLQPQHSFCQQSTHSAFKDIHKTKWRCLQHEQPAPGWLQTSWRRTVKQGCFCRARNEGVHLQTPKALYTRELRGKMEGKKIKSLVLFSINMYFIQVFISVGRESVQGAQVQGYLPSSEWLPGHIAAKNLHSNNWKVEMLAKHWVCRLAGPAWNCTTREMYCSWLKDSSLTSRCHNRKRRDGLSARETAGADARAALGLGRKGLWESVSEAAPHTCPLPSILPKHPPPITAGEDPVWPRKAESSLIFQP